MNINNISERVEKMNTLKYLLYASTEKKIIVILCVPKDGK